MAMRIVERAVCHGFGMETVAARHENGRVRGTDLGGRWRHGNGKDRFPFARG
jgi:hypothetical protein